MCDTLLRNPLSRRAARRLLKSANEGPPRHIYPIGEPIDCQILFKILPDASKQITHGISYGQRLSRNILRLSSLSMDWNYQAPRYVIRNASPKVAFDDVNA